MPDPASEQSGRLCAPTAWPPVPLWTALEKPDICLRDSWYMNIQDALFLTAEKWKPPKCPSADEWINRMWSICTPECCPAVGRRDFLCPYAPYSRAVKEARHKEVHPAGSLRQEIPEQMELGCPAQQQPRRSSGWGRGKHSRTLSGRMEMFSLSPGVVATLSWKRCYYPRWSVVGSGGKIRKY